MLGAVAGLGSQHGVEIDGAECVAVSFPRFFDLVERLRRETGEIDRANRPQ
jgi:5-enolpyruvylshikimate-3-phosphate synthase